MPDEEPVLDDEAELEEEPVLEDEPVLDAFDPCAELPPFEGEPPIAVVRLEDEHAKPATTVARRQEDQRPEHPRTIEQRRRYERLSASVQVRKRFS
jgi:hypothetical protein